MRIVMHIDMDAFFAAIEERERPELKGKPIVVGADPKGGHGRGVVSTASYAARKFGIKSALPISQAWRLCPAPQCAYLPVDGKLYGIVSERIMNVVRECVERYAEAESPLQRRLGLPILIEQVSIDEAYVELMNHESPHHPARAGGAGQVGIPPGQRPSRAGGMNNGKPWEIAEKMAREIKREILRRERLTCSIGIGSNKLIAKIASDFKKPDGLTVVRSEEAADFLAPLPIRALPGIGPKTEVALRRRGIETIADLRVSLPEDDELFERAWGIDNSPVVEEYESKSLGHETTFERDSRDQAMLTKTMLELCDEVLEEARKEGVAFRTITVRVRYANFATHTSAHTLREPTSDATILRRETLKLLFPYFKQKRLIRLVGVRVSKLEGR